MLKKIIHFSINNKLIIGLFTLGLTIWGIYQVTRLPIDAVPDITDNQVQIITICPSLGAPDVERLISFPVEQVNSNIPGLKQIRSFSRFGLSIVTIVFDDGIDIYWARQQVSERLQQVQSELPLQIGKPQLAPLTTGLGEIYQYVVKTKKGYQGKYDVMQLRTIQDWIVRRQLMGTPGVADVSSFGGMLKQYEIALHTSKLNSYGLNIDDVFTALQKNNQNTGGAYIEKGPTVFFIRSEGLVNSITDLKNIVIRTTSHDVPVLIGDVAEVRLGGATRYGAMTYNDEGEVAGAVVMMLKGENSSAVIKRVKEKIQQIQKTLPEGVIIESFLDRTKMVNNSISTVQKNLAEGALIVVFVLVLFLGNLRAGLVVASVIPLSMLFAIILMNAFGVSGNLMSLGAIDFGLIVDGAVIIVEAVMHRLSISKKFEGGQIISQSDMDSEVKQSASRMMNAAVFGQVIILIVYLPIFSLQGIEGKMFRPMAQTVAFALTGAFILSLTYVPMMSTLFLSKKVAANKNISERVMARLEILYGKSLLKAFAFSKPIILLCVILFIGSILILTKLGGEFIPKLEEGDFAVETTLLPGTGLSKTTEVVYQSARILKEKFPEVIKVVGKIGSGEIPIDPMPINNGDMIIILRDKKYWTSAKSFDELAEKMNKALQDIPGVTFGFQYPVQMRFNELISGARQDVVCKIFGENLDSLVMYANRFEKIVNKVNGATDLYIEKIAGMPQIVVKYNRASIARYGLNIENINRTINTAFAGQTAGQVFENERRFDLIVRLENTQRKDIRDVQNLLISTPTGIQIPLSQVAEIQQIEGPNQIQREDAKRRIIVGFNVRGRDVSSVVKELRQNIQQQIKFPPAYFVVYGGAFENLEAATKRLSFAVPISLLLIFVMLYFAIGNVKEGLLIYTAIPLSAIGGILALAMRDLPFSISAGVGFIALFGVAVLNGIVLISEFNQLLKRGRTDIKMIALEGTKNRLRPVLMTAMVASLGFIPMAVSNGAGAEVQRPLATVVIGGLISATFLTLYILPILFLLFQQKQRSKSSIMPTIMIGMLIICCSLSTISTKAQMPISLQGAVDSAIKNNLSIRSSEINIRHSRQLVKTVLDIPKTNLTTEYGQLNSINNDTYFGVSQTVSFPTVYKKQRALSEAQVIKNQVELSATKNNIIGRVKQQYYFIVSLKEKEKLLFYADSVYAEFLKKAELRFKKGETNVLEKTSGEIYRRQISMQLQLVKADLNIALRNFNVLINTVQNFIPATVEFKLPDLMSYDTANTVEWPSVQLLQQEILLAQKNQELQKSKLLPDLMFGYVNQSFVGVQNINGTDKYFSGSKRFNSVQAGISIPIFAGAQNGRIKAAKTEVLQSQVKLDREQQQLMAEHQNACEEYRIHMENVKNYESFQLVSAEIMVKTANLQFLNGVINYLEWAMIINQSITVRSGYLDAIQAANKTHILIETLTGNIKH